MAKSIFYSLLCFLAVSCGTTPQTHRKPLALVSIAPYQFLVERIAGNHLHVRSVVPQATNPHSFEPTAKQVGQLAQGTIWFRIGEPFEEKIIPILMEQNPDLWVQDLREGIELIPESSSFGCHHCAMEHLDRHIWMSPKLTILQVEQITATLSERFPDQADAFRQNASLLTKELTALDQEIETLLKPVEKRQLLVSHPAFGYFCRD